MNFQHIQSTEDPQYLSRTDNAFQCQSTEFRGRQGAVLESEFWQLQSRAEKSSMSNVKVKLKKVKFSSSMQNNDSVQLGF